MQTDKQVPLLILSDSPLGSSGLGRIARELAERLVTIPEIRVGFAGLGGTWSQNLPYPFYPLQKGRTYVLEQLPEVWRDFAGDQKGVLLTIWNHTWLSWLTDPRYCPPEMRDFIENKPFELWGYIPVDSTRADGTLPMGDTLSKFDRLLAYTAFGQDAIGKTTQRPVPALPHGLDARLFHPLDRNECRRNFGLPLDQTIVGCVATNSERKDWGLAFEIMAELPADTILWAHTDFANGPSAYWDLKELAEIHKVRNIIITTFHYTDEAMAKIYSACDVTLGIGHEGYGLPLSESLACGTPVVTMDWAGQTEFVPKEMRIPPVTFHQTGPGSYLRPVHDAFEWRAKVQSVLELSRNGNGESLLDSQFEWDNCFPKWESWMKAGLK